MVGFLAVRSQQILGLVSFLLGVLILFLLREPLYKLIVLVLQLIGIFVGLLLIVVGVALIFGGRWVRRRGPWGQGSKTFSNEVRHVING